MHLAAKHIVAIPNRNPAPLAAIGGKGLSLQTMAAAGLPVPPALVLTTGFFQPWFDALALAPPWHALPGASAQQLPAVCDELKTLAIALPLHDPQLRALADLFARLSAGTGTQLYAVRSSAPEEDMASASFAGVYDTELGVTVDAMEAAIRRCFASSLDHRVFAYKRQKGMPLDRPGIALVVQQQLDSEVAGVAFSINPLTNDYDEAAIDANWGLGESVVSGMASTDHFIVDKVGGAVIERQLGAKQLSVALDAGGGTSARPDPRAAQFCLSDARLRELTTTLCQLEALYGHPVDMEWAYEGGKLFLLQARPITAYVPLAPEMITPPGARRVLYMDIALSQGLTLNTPISPIGLDWFATEVGLLVRHAIGKADLDLVKPDGLVFLSGARMYLNLSNLLWFSSPRQLASSHAVTDKLMAEILAAIDVATYRAARRPAWIGPALRIAPKALWRMRRAIWRGARSVLAPVSTHRQYQRATQALEKRLAAPFDDSLPLDQFQRRYGTPAIGAIFDTVMPALAIGIWSVNAAQALARKRSPEEQALAERLGRGIGGNLVVDMGIRMFRMAQMLDATEFDDIDALAARIERRQAPAPFLLAWDGFMATYGCRGPGEMDLGSVHYADDPLLVLRQMSFMAASSGQFDPDATHQRLAREREQAYQALMQRFGWLRRALLRRAHAVASLFAGSRDTPKHYNLMYQRAVHGRLMAEGRKLATEGRLDRPEQVFDLGYADLAAADGDAALDLRALGRHRTQFARLLADHVRSFPAVIDSRGRILRAPRRIEKKGELTGMAVSPGRITGPVKVLRHAREKPIDKGDILVAFSTDPGWTPLFVNAAAVVLEVGGVLQHGAVVAREYGKPCVVGISDVLSRLKDGQLVEVDGSSGVVRVVG